MRRIAGLLVATTHLGFAGHALAQGPGKTSHSTKRAMTAGSGGQAKRIEALGTSSPPEESKPAPRSLFAYADRDKDGSVSFSEFATAARESLERRIARRFQQLDKNHDGGCTRGEVNKMSLARFLRFDLDRDGRFTQSELAVVMKRELGGRLELAYARLDVDRDGRFSMAELTPIPTAREPAKQARKAGEVARSGPGSVQ
jgi:Ca2+-binding EF-hand superfamily protein